MNHASADLECKHCRIIDLENGDLFVTDCGMFGIAAPEVVPYVFGFFVETGRVIKDRNLQVKKFSPGQRLVLTQD